MIRAMIHYTRWMSSVGPNKFYITRLCYRGHGVKTFYTLRLQDGWYTLCYVTQTKEDTNVEVIYYGGQSFDQKIINKHYKKELKKYENATTANP